MSFSHASTERRLKLRRRVACGAASVGWAPFTKKEMKTNRQTKPKKPNNKNRDFRICSDPCFVDCGEWHVAWVISLWSQASGSRQQSPPGLAPPEGRGTRDSLLARSSDITATPRLRRAGAGGAPGGALLGFPGKHCSRWLASGSQSHTSAARLVGRIFLENLRSLRSG